MNRGLLRRTVMGAGVLAFAAGAGAAMLRGRRPGARAQGLSEPVRVYPPEGGRVVLDPGLAPRTLREPPALAGLVSQGRLPPVAERVGSDPLVIAPLHQIGRYGGVLHRAFTGPSDFQTAARFASGPDSLLYFDTLWREVVPNIARSFEVSADGRVLTLHLRRGMRWSDGAPFTADDILFWYEDLYLDRRVVTTPSPTLQIEGRPVEMRRLDAATVEFVAPKSYSLLPEVLASYTDLGGPSISGRNGMGGFAPRHYLSRFHPKYASEADLQRAAREAGFVNWAIRLKNRNDWALNPQLPVVSPWRPVSAVNSPSFDLERNPYSIWVDTAGNQLPYVDRLHHVFCATPDGVNFKAATGVLDSQDRHLSVSKLPFLLSNRRRSGYEVYIDPYEGADVGVRLNLDYRADPEIGALLADRAFRRALSLAVDRAAINETLMLGMGRPSAAAPAPGGKYYPGPDWAMRWAQLDVGQANRLLDGLGLARRDREGFRMRRDGAGRLRLRCEAYKAHFDYPAVGEMVREQWRAIGVDLDVRIIESNLWLQKAMAGSLQLAVQFAGVEDPYSYPDLLFPFTSVGPGAMMGVEYARWFQTNGAAGREPPPVLRGMMDLWRQGREADAENRLRIGRELIRRHVEEVLSIGLISGGPSFYGVRLANRDLGNVPRRVVNTQLVRSPANGLPMTYFFRSAARRRT